MKPAAVLDLLVSRGAVTRGHFRLSSGRHSDLYVQCASVCQWPSDVGALGSALAVRLEVLAPTLVLGPAMGGVVIAHEVARSLDVRMIFAERLDGAMTIRRGFVIEPEDRVVIVEDVVTTGRSPIEVANVVGTGAGEVVGFASIVDRSGGVDLGHPFEALTRVDANDWTEDTCPLCDVGEPITTPGSRFARS